MPEPTRTGFEAPARRNLRTQLNRTPWAQLRAPPRRWVACRGSQALAGSFRQTSDNGEHSCRQDATPGSFPSLPPAAISTHPRLQRGHGERPVCRARAAAKGSAVVPSTGAVQMVSRTVKFPPATHHLRLVVREGVGVVHTG